MTRQSSLHLPRSLAAGAAVVALAIGLVGSTASAAPQDGMTFEMPAMPAMPAIDGAFGEADRNTEAVRRGEALLRDVAKAYRTVPMLTDVIKLDVNSPFGSQSDSIDLLFGKGTDALLRVTGITITSLNGEVFVEIPDISDDKYVGVPLKDRDLVATLMEIESNLSLPVPHLALRFSTEDTDLSKLLNSIATSAVEDLAVGGHRREGEHDEVLVKGSNGVAIARVNGETRLLDRVRISFAPADAPPGLTLELNMTFAPRVVEELPEAIAFDAGERKRVSTLESLMQKLEIGQDAPTFALKTLDGTKVDLKDLRGSVVVLDLWATWCGPCRRGLPLLDQFAKWVATEGKPVKVFGVNVWEDQEKDAAARTERAKAYWTEAGFSFPTLMDLTDSLADDYGPQGIPTTFIICPEGKIAAIHNGFSENMVEMLKADVAKAMGKSDAAPARPE